MRFKIISAGWECEQFIPRTLASVEKQTLDNWDIGISYDPSNDKGARIIKDWCEKDPAHRSYMINTEKKYATRNHYETITRLDPEDDDIIIFLDLDGDQLAHPHVLERLRDAYANGALVTYGQYRPLPDMGTSGLAQQYPGHIINANSYRQYHRTGGMGFNHPRTISGKIFKAIPEDMFKWRESGAKRLPNGERYDWNAGDFYRGSTDYLFMVSSLELANGRYHCFEEVLLLYNHANPLADNKTQPQHAHVCLLDFYSRPPLKPLEIKAVVPMTNSVTKTPVYLSADERRVILREYGLRYNLSVFVETGTNDGGTPWELKHDFSTIYTIELGQPQWLAASNRFRRFSHVTCLHGDSADILPEIFQTMGKKSSLFWLDGHYSGPGTARGDVDTPVRKELELLFEDIKNNGKRHVILVDDARLFGGGVEHTEEFADYPSISWVKELAENHGYNFEHKDDIMRLTPA